jgi:hypothetical protein
MFERFKKGKRVHTRWDKNTEQVTILREKAKTVAPEQKIKVEVPADCENGKVANLSLVQHTSDEFVLDFGIVPPGRRAARIVARVVMAPSQVKKLAALLKKNLL